MTASIDALPVPEILTLSLQALRTLVHAFELQELEETARARARACHAIDLLVQVIEEVNNAFPKLPPTPIPHVQAP